LFCFSEIAENRWVDAKDSGASASTRSPSELSPSAEFELPCCALVFFKEIAEKRIVDALFIPPGRLSPESSDDCSSSVADNSGSSAPACGLKVGKFGPLPEPGGGVDHELPPDAVGLADSPSASGTVGGFGFDSALPSSSVTYQAGGV
jgi:hypothetical protein